MRKCAYCDKKRKLTKEHIWPKCIIKRMPELELKYLESKQIFITSELVISDVCTICNNEKLSILDSYFCLLYDTYFKDFHEQKKVFKFQYDYNLLLRSLLKITFNSSRTVERENNFFEKFRNYILDGNEHWESIIVKLDIVTPWINGEDKIYPKSARCGKSDIGYKTDNFVVRAVSVNSFYFYILFCKSEFLPEDLVAELHYIESRIPGTIIHPYRNETMITKFSTDDTYKAHIDFINRTADALDKKNKNSR